MRSFASRRAVAFAIRTRAVAVPRWPTMTCAEPATRPLQRTTIFARPGVAPVSLQAQAAALDRRRRLAREGA